MNTSIDPGEGWRLLQPGEPLQKGDGFFHPAYKTIWLDYECRPDIFRVRFGVVEPGLEVNREYAHTYPWRRRISGTSKSEELKKACGIVERYARAIGKDCQMILTNEAPNDPRSVKAGHQLTKMQTEQTKAPATPPTGTLETIIQEIIQHDKDHPDHGIGCSCMDKHAVSLRRLFIENGLYVKNESGYMIASKSMMNLLTVLVGIMRNQ